MRPQRGICSKFQGTGLLVRLTFSYKDWSYDIATHSPAIGQERTGKNLALEIILNAVKTDEMSYGRHSVDVT